MAIDNTEKHPHPEWVLGGNPTAIEAQEAQGQQQLAASSQLPAEGLTPELAAKHNIQIVGPSRRDDLFVDVRLPRGAAVRSTGHPMWSDLVDESGAVIGHIFYKAAFYDRCAFIRFD